MLARVSSPARFGDKLFGFIAIFYDHQIRYLAASDGRRAANDLAVFA